MSLEELKRRALEYHSTPKPGKLSIICTKPMTTQADLALAYTPGVAQPVREIAEHPELAYKYTSKGNLVAVITNGTAVLGLGNVGALASKPVMEGKAVLFKKFADVDVFDLEINAQDANDFIDTVARLEPTFGGINLEDIKAPECFGIEEELKSRMKIPVFHDDQHGTAIIVAAGLLNALELQNKKINEVSIVCLGAGAAGIATMKLLLELGVSKKQITMVDSKGVVNPNRDDLNKYKQLFARSDKGKTLADAMRGADVFIGVSGPNLLDADTLLLMNPNPIVFALSNPDPEILPSIAYATRNDLVMATGRSDYPNQVNNVLCFPYIFRGALDVRAREINQTMLIAAVHAVKDLARLPIPDAVLQAYPRLLKLGDQAKFGPDYFLPAPTDPRLLQVVSGAVAQAARDTGVAQL